VVSCSFLMQNEVVKLSCSFEVIVVDDDAFGECNLMICW